MVLTHSSIDNSKITLLVSNVDFFRLNIRKKITKSIQTMSEATNAVVSVSFVPNLQALINPQMKIVVPIDFGIDVFFKSQMPS